MWAQCARSPIVSPNLRSSRILSLCLIQLISKLILTPDNGLSSIYDSQTFKYWIKIHISNPILNKGLLDNNIQTPFKGFGVRDVVYWSDPQSNHDQRLLLIVVPKSLPERMSSKSIDENMQLSFSLFPTYFLTQNVNLQRLLQWALVTSPVLLFLKKSL